MRFSSLHVTQSMQIKNICESWWKNKIHSIFCSKQHKWLRQELWLEKKTHFYLRRLYYEEKKPHSVNGYRLKRWFLYKIANISTYSYHFFLPISICFYIFNNVTTEWVLEKKSYLDYLKGRYFTIKPPPTPIITCANFKFKAIAPSLIDMINRAWSCQSVEFC